MTREVRFSRSVRLDLYSIWNFISARSGEAPADAYCDRITALCERLNLYPERGTLRSASRNARVIGFERRVSIAYHVTDNAVIIDRIRYAGRQR